MDDTSQDLLELNNSKEFNELVHVGHLVRAFDWYNHQFEIKTLKLEEELVVGQIIKEFKDTVAEEKAAAVAIAAACIVSINGKLFMPQYEKTSYNYIKEKYNYIIKNLNWVVVEAVNGEYIQLLASMYDSIERVENLSEQDRMKSDFTSDPLIEQE